MCTQDINLVFLKKLPSGDSEIPHCKEIAQRLIMELNGLPIWKAKAIIAEMAIAVDLNSKVEIGINQKSE